MILVDTNVWSEATKATPNANVRGWANAHSDHLWLSTVVLGELLSGVALMPEGKRKDGVQAQYEAIIQTYGDRIADFDLISARHYAEILAYLEREGRNPATADVQIAATALSRNMALATRNVRHFQGLGIELINPWGG